ncbi:hypothetical protein IAU60_001714 [Kwoniella sp. DSM 27419]
MSSKNSKAPASNSSKGRFTQLPPYVTSDTEAHRKSTLDALEGRLPAPNTFDDSVASRGFNRKKPEPVAEASQTTSYGSVTSVQEIDPNAVKEADNTTAGAKRTYSSQFADMAGNIDRAGTGSTKP